MCETERERPDAVAAVAAVEAMRCFSYIGEPRRVALSWRDCSDGRIELGGARGEDALAVTTVLESTEASSTVELKSGLGETAARRACNLGEEESSLNTTRCMGVVF